MNNRTTDTNVLPSHSGNNPYDAWEGGVRKPDDMELIESAKNGDEDAWCALLQRYADIIQWAVHVAVSRCKRDRDDALSCALGAFMSAVGRYDGRTPFPKYLTGLARRRAMYADSVCPFYIPTNIRLCLDKLPKHRSVAGWTASTPSHVEQCERREEWERVEAAINRLPPKEYRVIRDRMNGDTFSAIAPRVGLSLPGVQHAERRAISKLKAELNV